MKDWNGREIRCAYSQGGVIAVTHPFDNLITTGCCPWPTPEVLQKLYRSPQTRAFSQEQLAVCTSGLGYYCDLQSLHSEDAITWSVFGTAGRSPGPKLAAWLAELLTMLGLPDVQTKEAEIFLWRRIPHPDTLGPGGPEIDVGISTANTLVLIEAKWLSGVGAAQGKKKDKNQIQLRGELLGKYAPELLPSRSQLAVVGVGLSRDTFADTTPDGILFRSATWEAICSLPTHPLTEEVRRYFKWKVENTRIADNALGRAGDRYHRS